MFTHLFSCRIIKEESNHRNLAPFACTLRMHSFLSSDYIYIFLLVPVSRCLSCIQFTQRSQIVRYLARGHYTMSLNHGGVLDGRNIDEEAAISSNTIEESKREDGAGNTPSVSSDDSRAEEIVLDWVLPDDPANPHNWPIWKKVYHTAIPALFGFIM